MILKIADVTLILLNILVYKTNPPPLGRGIDDY